MDELLIDLYAALPVFRKPTIENDTWVDRPPPPQDAEWLKRHGYPTNSEKAERK